MGHLPKTEKLFILVLQKIIIKDIILGKEKKKGGTKDDEHTKPCGCRERERERERESYSLRDNKNGITLIALVITVIVLLILAGVAINLAIGERGIFNQSKLAAEKYEEERQNEENELEKATNEIASYVGGSRDTIDMNWKLVGTSTGTTPITLPSDWKELHIKIGINESNNNPHRYIVFNNIREDVDAVGTEFGNGAVGNGYIIYFLSESQIHNVLDYWVNTDRTSQSTITVYYR